MSCFYVPLKTTRVLFPRASKNDSCPVSTCLWKRLVSCFHVPLLFTYTSYDNILCVVVTFYFQVIHLVLLKCCCRHFQISLKFVSIPCRLLWCLRWNSSHWWFEGKLIMWRVFIASVPSKRLLHHIWIRLRACIEDSSELNLRFNDVAQQIVYQAWVAPVLL